jgi:hypothetical protein
MNRKIIAIATGAVIATAAVLTLTACSGSTNGNGTPITPPPAAPTQPVAPVQPAVVPVSPSVPSQPVVGTCTDADIAVTAPQGMTAAMGHTGVVFDFTNTSNHPCRMSGYPGVATVNSNGQAVQNAIRTPNGYLGGLPSGATQPGGRDELRPPAHQVAQPVPPGPPARGGPRPYSRPLRRFGGEKNSRVHTLRD